MIEIGTMSALLAISEGEMVSEMVVALLASTQISRFIRIGKAQGRSLKQRLQRWRHQVNDTIAHTPVPPVLEQEFLLYQHFISLSLARLVAELPTLLSALERGSDFADEGRQLAHQLVDHPTEGTKRLMLEKWRASLVGALLRLQQELAEAERLRLQQELEEQIGASEELEQVLDPQRRTAGGLWNLAQGRWQPASLVLIRQYAAMLRKEPMLQEIADSMGRSLHDSEQLQRPQPPQPTLIQEPVLSDDVPDDLVGIHPANDLMRMLPSEAVMLGVPELELEFYRRYLERRLLSYQARGTLPRHQLLPRTTDRGDQELQPMGPVIVCIDTSGSMGGYPEQCAKALALALLQLALTEQRRCFVMLFSTDVATFELTDANGLDEAQRFLAMTFNGGTDLLPCLSATLQQLQAPGFELADVLVISDFIAQRLPASLVELMDRQRGRGTRFNAVAMSRHAKPALLRVFDKSWLLDCGLRGRLLRRWLRS
ncbi:TPA: ATPase RavA stimulator ViaA [Aeromonas salmonicida subsp. pectinolytica]